MPSRTAWKHTCTVAEWLYQIFCPCSITVRPSLMTSSRYTFGFVFVRMGEGGGGGSFALVVINTRVHNPHAHKCIHIQYMYTHTHTHTHTHCIPFITAATVQGALHVLLLSPVVHVYLHNWAMMKQTFITILQVHHLCAVFPAVQIRSAHMYFSIYMYMYECIPNVSLYRCLQVDDVLGLMACLLCIVLTVYIVYWKMCLYCLCALCASGWCHVHTCGGGGGGMVCCGGFVILTAWMALTWVQSSG